MEACRWSRSFQKRTFDVLVSAIILASTLVVGALIWAVVRLTSKGPALFCQQRAGLEGKLFTVYKFRTMVAGSDSTGPGLTCDGDLRLTPVGKILRKVKLDEIPQFYNVLRGDMSLVGPRPKLPEYSVASDWLYRPGITSLATLTFRREEEILKDVPAEELDSFYQSQIRPFKARLDRWYMRRASFVSDLAIIWKTASACVALAPLPQCSKLCRRLGRIPAWVGEPQSIEVGLETQSVE